MCGQNPAKRPERVCLYKPNGMTKQFEDGYRAAAGKCIWEESVVDPDGMQKALAPMTLDVAYPRFRRIFFEAEKKRQGPLPAPVAPAKLDKQKALFANYWVHLHQIGAIQRAMDLCEGNDTPTRLILEDTLLVNTGFHRMLVARSFALLLGPRFPRDGGAREVYVGAGAAPVIRRFAQKSCSKGGPDNQKELQSDLGKLHGMLSNALDEELLRLICPNGWQLDFTEHACCELRRYQEAREKVAEGKRPRRKRKAGAEARQNVRERRLRAGWRSLGFKDLPSQAVRADAAAPNAPWHSA